MKLSPLFQVASSEPAKLRRGNTNFAVVDPPLKLVLIEDPTKIPVWLNHLGVVVASSEEVAGPAGEGTRPRHRGGRRRLPDLFVATAIYNNMTLDAMSDLDLCYSPPLGSPWDAVQMAAQAWTRDPPAQRSTTVACSRLKRARPASQGRAHG